MKNAIGILVLTVVGCGGGGSGGGGASSGGEDLTSSVSIRNTSSYAIHRMHVSAVNDPNWGPDQLASDVLASGETFTLTGVPCDTYDVRLVDEDGDECIVRGVAICGEDQGWVLDDSELTACEAFTQQ
jgi:hypothetical protein